MPDKEERGEGGGERTERGAGAGGRQGQERDASQTRAGRFGDRSR